MKFLKDKILNFASAENQRDFLIAKCMELGELHDFLVFIRDNECAISEIGKVGIAEDSGEFDFDSGPLLKHGIDVIKELIFYGSALAMLRSIDNQKSLSVDN